MIRHHFVLGLSLCALIVDAGCVASPEDAGEGLGLPPSPGAEVDALNGNALNGNALNGNALNGNALNGNALNGNALNGNGVRALAPSMLGPAALAPASLSQAASASLQDAGANGDLSRQLLKYTVSCAFDGTQSFPLTWVDAEGVRHEESYPGLLGLAPGWASAPLDATGQGWISACLISRVNYFGVSVQLSSRGPVDALATTADERATYPTREGAFWGNVFTDTPTAYACDDDADDDHSRAASRVCAAGYVDASGAIQSCPVVQRVGACASRCASVHRTEGYYVGCSADGSEASSEVVTVFLQ